MTVKSAAAWNLVERDVLGSHLWASLIRASYYLPFVFSMAILKVLWTFIETRGSSWGECSEPIYSPVVATRPCGAQGLRRSFTVNTYSKTVYVQSSL
jgi:hypothetical protein